MPLLYIYIYTNVWYVCMYVCMYENESCFSIAAPSPRPRCAERGRKIRVRNGGHKELGCGSRGRSPSFIRIA